MKNELGIMQGRLSPRSEGRYQSHPIQFWQSEFFIARELGLQLVEFILDSWSLKQNPLLTPEGRKAIKDIGDRSGVGIKSICADVFMDYTFAASSANSGQQQEHYPIHAVSLLRETISAAAELSIQDIVIPCVDRSSLPDEASQAMFVERILPLCEQAVDSGVRINIESDWDPITFSHVLDAVGRDKVWVNYDIGNSSALGFNPREEFAAYGMNISDLHIKDRKLNDASVVLGTGDADFEFIIKWLQANAFSGHMIFQAARAEHFVDDLQLVRTQIEWFKQQWQDMAHG